MKTLTEFIEETKKEREKYITEVASWDDPDKIKKDRDTISCDDDETYEREPIRRAVAKKYPNQFRTSEINDAIEQCCKKKGQSRQREEFYKCVHEYLFKKIS
jgi:hypothetical protein